MHVFRKQELIRLAIIAKRKELGQWRNVPLRHWLEKINPYETTLEDLRVKLGPSFAILPLKCAECRRDVDQVLVLGKGIRRGHPGVGVCADCLRAGLETLTKP